MTTAPEWTYVIKRDCCLHGQCDHCSALPFGTKVRVEQLRTKDEKVADFAMLCWRAWNAKRSRRLRRLRKGD